MGCADVKNDSDALKSDGRLFRDSQRSLQVQMHPPVRDIDAFGGYFHRRGYHLASDLRASGERPQQEVSGACAGACAANALVCLRVVERPSQVD